MARRSLYEMIFGKKQQNTIGTSLQLLNGFDATFTNFNGNIYNTTWIRSCIDTIARNGAKLSPRHIRSNDREFTQLNKSIARIIAEQPNELDNAFSFYYKVISQLFLNNNAFIFIQRDSKGTPVGLYPLTYGSYKLLEYKGDIYVSFHFRNGQYYSASLKDDVIHLKRFYCENDIVGAANEPITKTMSIKHIVDEGIVNAIKTTQSIRGVLKTQKAMLKPEDIKRTRDQFVHDFISAGNGSGIAGLDATTDFIPVALSPQTATDGQIKQITDEIFNYFGLNQNIVQSKYNEDEWSAFYESVLEPVAVQMSLEFTNKIFTITERWHGNRIVFEANRLQYASNNTKIKLARYMNNYFTINEIREVFNMAPVEGGDQFAIDVNHTLSDDINGDDVNNEQPDDNMEGNTDE